MSDTGKVAVLMTAGDEAEAGKIARALVEEKLAACVNIVPSIRSIYMWQGKICDDGEVLMIAKTTLEKFKSLEARVRQLHSYDTPEIIALSVADGSSEYLGWIDDCLD